MRNHAPLPISSRELPWLYDIIVRSDATPTREKVPRADDAVAIQNARPVEPRSQAAQLTRHQLGGRRLSSKGLSLVVSIVCLVLVATSDGPAATKDNGQTVNYS